MTHQTKAEVFAQLHRKGDPLLLANAWDAASAAVIETAGARAIATTSSGMAWTMGVPDGGVLGPRQLAQALSRIVAAVAVPVSADIEDGYGPRPTHVAETVHAVVDAGAVGVNLEDRPGGQRELFSPVEQATRTGADSLFVPGAIDPEAVAALAAGPLPLNVMVWAGAPPVAVLAALGVARISLGSAIAEAAYGLAERAAREMFTAGTYDQTAGGLPYTTLNSLLTH